MKNILFTIIAICVTCFAQGQTRLQVIDSIKIIPVDISSIDSPRVVIYTHIGGSPCRITESETTIQNYSITINAKFFFGLAALNCHRVDTIYLDPLSAGVYDLIFNLTSATYGTFLDADTINFTVQPAVGIGEAPGKGLFHMYPNPASNTLMLCKNVETREPFAVKVFNATGNLVLEQETTGLLTELDISHLTMGIYFIQITGKQGKKMGASFVKRGF